jgi:hypothetical protein
MDGDGYRGKDTRPHTPLLQVRYCNIQYYQCQDLSQLKSSGSKAVFQLVVPLNYCDLLSILNTIITAPLTYSTVLYHTVLENLFSRKCAFKNNLQLLENKFLSQTKTIP